VIHVPADHPTIQRAIDRSQHGDTVLVSPGIYEENINFHGKSICLSSTASADSTILRALLPEFPAITLESCEDSTTTIRGFTITSEHKRGRCAILCKGASPSILSNRIVGISVGNPPAAGIALEGPDCHPVIRGNIFDRNDGPVIAGAQVDGALIDSNRFMWNTPWRGAVIYFRKSTNLRITGNLIHDNHSGAMGFHDVNGLVIDHNTIVRNNSHGAAAVSFGDYCKDVSVTNTIVAFDLGAYTIHWSGSWSGFAPPVVRGNCLYGITLGSCSGFNPDPSQNLFTNPVLCAIDDQNFSLAENSPCIGAGVDHQNVGASSPIGCQGYHPVSGVPKPQGFTRPEEAPMQANPWIRLHYPEMAIQAGASGTVWIEAFVDRDGHVTHARVLESSRTGLGFEESALKAAYDRVYRPAIHKGSPVATWITFEISFDYQWWEKNEKGIIFDMD